MVLEIEVFSKMNKEIGQHIDDIESQINQTQAELWLRHKSTTNIIRESHEKIKLLGVWNLNV